jgi:tRNA pseudouridine32 synthase/23S rRNA pseudouridine746 synthase
MTVLEFLIEHFPSVAPDEWLRRMVDGGVVDDGGAPLAPGAPYRAHAKLFYYRSIADEPPIPFEETVLFRDDLLVVADKPHFLPVVPAGRHVRETLLVRLKRKLGIDTLAPMHRIDRDTAGLVLFTVQPETRDAYQRLFRERAVAKVYEAIAPWRADMAWPVTCRNRLQESDAFMQMHEVEGEPNAETVISVLEANDSHAHYQLRPLTGQKHQLRAHMAGLGVPIANDRIYPLLKPLANDPEDFSAPLQLLAASIAFRDPLTGRERRFHTARSLRPLPTTVRY